MRTATLIALFGLSMGACSGTDDDKADSPAGDDDDVVGDDDDDVTPSGDSGGNGSPYFEPVAVGFEFQGIYRSTGALESFEQDGYEFFPIMIITFASERFFSLSGDAQEGEFCEAVAVFDPLPITKPNQIPAYDNTVFFSSYEVALNLESTNHDCAGVVDPANWGDSAELLIEPFVGAHLGYGFAPMTDYLRDQWSKKTLDEVGDSMVASYVALNLADGTWVAEDWTTAILYEWDETDRTLVDDGNGFLVPIDATGIPPGGFMPQAFVQSYAYWYQDFPLLDLSNLTDGAP